MQDRFPPFLRRKVTTPRRIMGMILVVAASLLFVSVYDGMIADVDFDVDAPVVPAVQVHKKETTAATDGPEIERSPCHRIRDIDQQNVCIYNSWQGLLPPFIAEADHPPTRRRYDVLPRICQTDPLPFSDVVLRSSFKAGSTFMKALVESLYQGNETRLAWLNETRTRHPRFQVRQPWLSVAFLRDPIKRLVSVYGQMLEYSNRKYHWYGEGDADWLDMPEEGPHRFRTFVASIKRRFYNEHLLPQLWFLSEDPDKPPNLTFVGRLERLGDDWAAMTANLGIPADVARDGQAFIDAGSSPKNKHRSENARISAFRALYEEPDANATLLDACNIYRADFYCFRTWLSAPTVCEESWKKEKCLI